MNETNRKDGAGGVDRLWDSQWVNIVNAPQVLNAENQEEAVNIAVRMTEQKMAENARLREPAGVPEGWVLVPRSDLLEEDSYGVHGSEFYRCKLCGNESGLLNKGIEHSEDCPLAAPQPPAQAQAQGGGEERKPDDGKVICPACCHQFRAIPVQVQRDMIAAGFEPPFTAPPSAPVGVAFSRCPDDGSLVSKQGHRLAYGGVPGCWRVKPEDFPTETQKPAAVGVDAVTALRIAHRHLDMDSMRVSHCKDASAIEAALAAQQPASDGGFTAADMMDARQEGRKEAQQPAAVDGAMVERLDLALAMYEQHRTTMQSLASSVGDFLRDYRALAAQPRGSDNDR